MHRNLGACVFHVSDFHWFSEKGARVGKFLSEVMHVSWIIVPGFSNEAHEYLNNWLNWKSNFESCYVVDLCQPSVWRSNRSGSILEVLHNDLPRHLFDLQPRETIPGPS